MSSRPCRASPGERMTKSIEQLWSDDPIHEAEEDLLGRTDFAALVASSLDACVAGQSSTVFGLAGPWGSGKSSLISLILGQLADDWKIAVFSPWAMPSSQGISFEFLAALGSAIGKKQSKARKAFKSYASIAIP